MQLNKESLLDRRKNVYGFATIVALLIMIVPTANVRAHNEMIVGVLFKFSTVADESDLAAIDKSKIFVKATLKHELHELFNSQVEIIDTFESTENLATLLETNPNVQYWLRIEFLDAFSLVCEIYGGSSDNSDSQPRWHFCDNYLTSIPRVSTAADFADLASNIARSFFPEETVTARVTDSNVVEYNVYIRCFTVVDILNDRLKDNLETKAAGLPTELGQEVQASMAEQGYTIVPQPCPPTESQSEMKHHYQLVGTISNKPHDLDYLQIRLTYVGPNQMLGEITDKKGARYTLFTEEYPFLAISLGEFIIDNWIKSVEGQQ